MVGSTSAFIIKNIVELYSELKLFTNFVQEVGETTIKLPVSIKVK